MGMLKVELDLDLNCIVCIRLTKQGADWLNNRNRKKNDEDIGMSDPYRTNFKENEVIRFYLWKVFEYFDGFFKETWRNEPPFRLYIEKEVELQ